MTIAVPLARAFGGLEGGSVEAVPFAVLVPGAVAVGRFDGRSVVAVELAVLVPLRCAVCFPHGGLVVVSVVLAVACGCRELGLQRIDVLSCSGLDR